MIRPVETRDAEAVSKLIQQLGYEMEVEEFQERIDAVLEARQVVFVAELDGRVVGLINYSTRTQLYSGGVIGRITEVVVDETVRKRGVGRALIDFVSERGRKLGHIRLELTCGLQRVDAHKFYRALGFTEDSKKFAKPLQ